MTRTLAVCIATYRRPQMLGRLLQAIASCEVPSGCCVQVRVIDNDSDGSALAAYSACEFGAIDAIYAIEIRRGIAAARNAAIEVGPADLVVFIDDDEVPTRDWLVRLVGSLDTTGADAVVGPVRGHCPSHAPPWIVRGGFFDKPTARAGEDMHWRGGRTSNTAIRGAWFYERGLRFNAAFGLSGAEDTEIFLQMAQRGARFAGAPEAWVSEDVEADRVTFAWLWQRHVRGGRNYRRLCNQDKEARSEVLLCTARVARGCAQLLTGLPHVLWGRPEQAIRGMFQFAVAIGGVEAWLMPAKASQTCAYPERPMESARCVSHS